MRSVSNGMAFRVHDGERGEKLPQARSRDAGCPRSGEAASRLRSAFSTGSRRRSSRRSSPRRRSSSSSPSCSATASPTPRHLAGWAKANGLDWLASFAKGLFHVLNSVRLTWAQELAIFMMIWMAKFGAAYGVRTGIHVGVDVLVERLPPGRAPR